MNEEIRPHVAPFARPGTPAPAIRASIFPSPRRAQSLRHETGLCAQFGQTSPGEGRLSKQTNGRRSGKRIFTRWPDSRRSVISSGIPNERDQACRRSRNGESAFQVFTSSSRSPHRGCPSDLSHRDERLRPTSQPLACLASRSRSRHRPGPVRRLQAAAPQVRSHRRGRRHVPLRLATTTTTAVTTDALVAPWLAMPGTTKTGLAVREPSYWTTAMRKWSSLAQTELAGEYDTLQYARTYADIAARPPLHSLSSRRKS